MNNIVVTDGMWRKSLSVVRSLGKCGFKVWVLGDTILTMAFWSRYTHRRIKTPSAKENLTVFSDNLLKCLAEVGNEGKPILFPMEDATINWLSENREQVSPLAYFLLPPAISLQIAQSKSATMLQARKIGLPIPETFEFESFESFYLKLSDLSRLSIIKNYIVKPISGSGSSGIIYLSDEIVVDWHTHWLKYGALIIQRRISAQGRGIGVSLIFDANGKCVADFVHARLQEYPNSGGPSTSRIGIRNDVLLRSSIKLLESLDWKGVAMVEWKEDPADGQPKIIEINPRFWGSLELAVRSGVNFPRIYADVAMGIKVNYPNNAKIGVICRWMMPGEILRYLTQDIQKRESLRRFIEGLPKSAEEWDSTDKLGSLMGVICTAMSAMNPKYWKYLNR